jgi:hypothetical protein
MASLSEWIHLLLDSHPLAPRARFHMLFLPVSDRPSFVWFGNRHLRSIMKTFRQTENSLASLRRQELQRRSRGHRHRPNQRACFSIHLPRPFNQWYWRLRSVVSQRCSCRPETVRCLCLTVPCGLHPPNAFIQFPSRQESVVLFPNRAIPVMVETRCRSLRPRDSLECLPKRPWNLSFQARTVVGDHNPKDHEIVIQSIRIPMSRIFRNWEHWRPIEGCTAVKRRNRRRRGPGGVRTAQESRDIHW